MRTNGDGKPVVALDIDGTLGDFHLNFLRFASLYFDRPNLVEDRIGRSNPGLPLWEWLGIDHGEYRESKLAYRQGGWKRWMPAYPGASSLTHEIRRAGAEVWLCTTRPYLRLDNVDPDTREWLRRNHIQYDALLFDPLDENLTKYDELKRQAGSRVASVTDDLPEMITAARSAGMFNPILRDQPYNQHLKHSRRAYNSDDIFRFVKEDLELWSKLQG